MNKFGVLNDNMTNIITKLTENQNLCKLLYYNSQYPLQEPDIDGSLLLYNNIYPYPIGTDTITEQKSLINVVFDDFKISGNSYFANNMITFAVLCHTDLWKIEEGANIRIFSILQEIDNLFNGSHVMGIGGLNFNSCNLVWATKNYVGYRVSYKKLACDR